jgi:hypothetical protein
MHDHRLRPRGGFYTAKSLNQKALSTVIDLAREKGTVESLELEVLLHGFRILSVPSRGGLRRPRGDFGGR